MTLKVIQGWEGGPMETGAFYQSAVTGRSGGFAARAGNASSVGQPVPSLGSFAYGFAIRSATYHGTAFHVGYEGIAGTTAHYYMLWDIVENPLTPHIKLFRSGDNVLLGTSTIRMPPVNAWVYIEVKGTIANSGGALEVRINEVADISFSGDTRNGGTVGQLDLLHFVPPGGSTMDIDDIYVCDQSGSSPYNTYLGDCVVKTLFPNGAGDSTQWTPSTGSNYACVDEDPANTTDYVGASTSGLTDLYAMADIASTDLPLGYQLDTYAAKSDGGTPPVMKPILKGASGTIIEESALSLSNTFLLTPGTVRTVDPDGNSLTPTRVNGMQAGVRSS